MREEAGQGDQEEAGQGDQEEAGQGDQVVTDARPSPEQPIVRIVTDVHEVLDGPPGPAGARWALAEPGRQLDANLIHLPPGQRVGTHTEPDLDVLLVVVAGAGVVGVPDSLQSVANGNVIWLSRGSTRSITAGEAGLSYLTVHRRRPGLQIRRRTP